MVVGDRTGETHDSGSRREERFEEVSFSIIIECDVLRDALVSFIWRRACVRLNRRHFAVEGEVVEDSIAGASDELLRLFMIVDVIREGGSG